jgi:hypothetical protein
VPQGSVLGPKEFIAYTEELAEIIGGCQLGHHLYADAVASTVPEHCGDA